MAADEGCERIRLGGFERFFGDHGVHPVVEKSNLMIDPLIEYKKRGFCGF
jgi:hypothetical protein